MNGTLDSKIPSGPLEKKWEKHRAESKLVNPANKRKYNIIMVGSGLAGGAGAASVETACALLSRGAGSESLAMSDPLR